MGTPDDGPGKRLVVAPVAVFGCRKILHFSIVTARVTRTKKLKTIENMTLSDFGRHGTKIALMHPVTEFAAVPSVTHYDRRTSEPH